MKTPKPRTQLKNQTKKQEKKLDAHFSLQSVNIELIRGLNKVRGHCSKNLYISSALDFNMMSFICQSKT